MIGTKWPINKLLMTDEGEYIGEGGNGGISLFAVA